MRVRADLFSTVDQIITTGVFTVGVGAALLAILADRRPPERIKEQQEAGFRWAVMGVISCIPLFNWLAWVFGALEDEESARTYYIFAALYALPFLHSGFDFDTFSWAMLLAGVAHIQAERIAWTEPELQAAIAKSLSPLQVVKTVWRAAAAAGSALLLPSGSGGRGLPPGGGRAWEDGVEGSSREEPEEELREQELRDFDRRMRDREVQRRRGGGGGGGA